MKEDQLQPLDDQNRRDELRKKLVPMYSGDNSDAFWQAVDQLEGPLYDAVYQMGCALQDLEGRVLTVIGDNLP